MSLTGKSAKSHKKQDLLNQKSPAAGFKCLRFAHKATAGDVGFSINALVTPSEMSSLGFSQPTPAELQAVNLQFYKKNLILASSARGLLQESLDFVVAANGQINFSTEFGVALQDEIFVGTVDPIVRSGSLMADTVLILETGSLAANTTDIPVGRSFKVNDNPNYQIGAVQVLIMGQVLMRNVANATAAPSADGDYQEVDNGSGGCNLIRLNNSDPSSRPYIVVSTQLSTVRSDGSLQEDLERQQATIDLIVDTLALLAGVPSTDFQAAPTQPLLRQFGDRVVTLEQNRARIDVTNTWTAAQTLIGDATGAAAATGVIGEHIFASASAVSLATSTAKTIATITLTPGDWNLTGAVSFNTTGTTSVSVLAGGISTTDNTLPAGASQGIPNGGGNTGHFRGGWQGPAYVPGSGNTSMFGIPTYRVLISSSLTVYLIAYATFTVSTCTADGAIWARRVR